jgi:two-component system OmpR family response regulator
VLRVGPLELDPVEHRVRLRGGELGLRPREYALLHYLMRRPGEAVSKSEILANVWDEFYEGDPNIVEVYVSYLRRKLAAPAERPVIETVRGVGYRLVPDSA